MFEVDGSERSHLGKPAARSFSAALAASAFVVAALLSSAPRAEDSGGFREGFRDPPRSFSQVPFWSWNGRLEPDRIRWQIDEMVEKGVYGAFLHARAGLNLDSTPYFSEG